VQSVLADIDPGTPAAMRSARSPLAWAVRVLGALLLLASLLLTLALTGQSVAGGRALVTGDAAPGGSGRIDPLAVREFRADVAEASAVLHRMGGSAPGGLEDAPLRAASAARAAAAARGGGPLPPSTGDGTAPKVWQTWSHRRPGVAATATDPAEEPDGDAEPRELPPPDTPARSDEPVPVLVGVGAATEPQYARVAVGSALGVTPVVSAGFLPRRDACAAVADEPGFDGGVRVHAEPATRAQGGALRHGNRPRLAARRIALAGQPAGRLVAVGAAGADGGVLDGGSQTRLGGAIERSERTGVRPGRDLWSDGLVVRPGGRGVSQGGPRFPPLTRGDQPVRGAKFQGRLGVPRRTGNPAEHHGDPRQPGDHLLVLPDGKVVDLADARVLRDGSLMLPDGVRMLRDGVLQLPGGGYLFPDRTRVPPNGDVVWPDGVTIHPDRSAVLSDGTHIPALPPSQLSKEILLPGGDLVDTEGVWRHPDGTAGTFDGIRRFANGTRIHPGGIVVWADGTIGLPDEPGTRLFRNGDRGFRNGDLLRHDGVCERGDGTDEHPDGTRDLPDGVREYPDGTRVDRDGTIGLVDGSYVLGEHAETLPDGSRLPRPADGSLLPVGTVVRANHEMLLPDGTRLDQTGTVLSPPGAFPFTLPADEPVQLDDGRIARPDRTVLYTNGTVEDEAGNLRLANGTTVAPGGRVVWEGGTEVRGDGTRLRADGVLVLRDTMTLELPDRTLVFRDDPACDDSGTQRFPDGSCQLEEGPFIRPGGGPPPPPTEGGSAPPATEGRLRAADLELVLPSGTRLFSGGRWERPDRSEGFGALRLPGTGRVILPTGEWEDPDGNTGDGAVMLQAGTFVFQDGIWEALDGSSGTGAVLLPSDRVVFADGRWEAFEGGDSGSGASISGDVVRFPDGTSERLPGRERAERGAPAAASTPVAGALHGGTAEPAAAVFDNGLGAGRGQPRDALASVFDNGLGQPPGWS
jgi:hypothetical protein